MFSPHFEKIGNHLPCGLEPGLRSRISPELDVKFPGFPIRCCLMLPDLPLSTSGDLEIFKHEAH